MLKSISIRDYRGFFTEQTINFAEPNGNSGSGLTVFIGPNNTGKTTTIEALLVDKNRKFKESERHNSKNPVIKISYDNMIVEYTNVNDGSLVNCSSEDTNRIQKLELISSRRSWNPYAVKENHSGESFQHSSISQVMRKTPEVDVASRLKTLIKSNEKKERFTKYLKKIIPNLTGWTIDTNDNGDYVKYQTANSSHQADILGDGVISIFRICAHLVEDSENKILIIDEPELSLHPTAQKALAKILSTTSCNRQIIVSTHSPYFTNWEDFLQGAKFIRFNKEGDKECTITTLRQDAYEVFIDKNTHEFQKPQLLDIVAKELLFSNKILFLEGQEDVGLIRQWLIDQDEEVNFDLFGYGTGGCGNIKLFLEMAKDMQLSKVGALYDNDAHKIYEKTKKSFPDFRVLKLPTDDIRDKKCDKCGQLRKIGIFDKNGKIKEEKRAEFEGIMQSFIEYFRESC